MRHREMRRCSPTRTRREAERGRALTEIRDASSSVLSQGRNRSAPKLRHGSECEVVAGSHDYSAELGSQVEFLLVKLLPLRCRQQLRHPPSLPWAFCKKKKVPEIRNTFL